ncbi:Inner membrane protein YbaN [Corynebacterium capitovis DSM 44611]|uniref:YbaN family protein n=1 Tax=Corynebacterium capitovis TaxID=131081 RepID=UPI0003786CEE|nr:YbaN family protein [Corynebacterium capitovis]WKD58373.1 Inner membrane protein YbaN [Corynebacterium capitovis DSM 44611]
MRYLYLAAGLLAAGFGALGAFLPLLPATPFLLTALFFFTRSSPRLEHRLLHHSVFGKYITDYYTGELNRTRKVRIIGLMWMSMALSMLIVRELWFTVMLMSIAVGVAIHISLLAPNPARAARFRARYKIPPTSSATE